MLDTLEMPLMEQILSQVMQRMADQEERLRDAANEIADQRAMLSELIQSGE